MQKLSDANVKTVYRQTQKRVLYKNINMGSGKMEKVFLSPYFMFGSKEGRLNLRIGSTGKFSVKTYVRIYLEVS